LKGFSCNGLLLCNQLFKMLKFDENIKNIVMLVCKIISNIEKRRSFQMTTSSALFFLTSLLRQSIRCSSKSAFNLDSLMSIRYPLKHNLFSIPWSKKISFSHYSLICTTSLKHSSILKEKSINLNSKFNNIS
jgi:hypothetical protein